MMNHAIFSIKSYIIKTEFIFNVLGIWILVLLCSPISAQETPVIVEPPHWWIGFEETQLELMLHGENIGLSTIKLLEGSAEIVGQTSLDSPNYLFLKLNLANINSAEMLKFSITYPDKHTQIFEYELKKRSSKSAERQGFSSSDVVYLITPDRFSNGDKSNDDLPQVKEQSDRTELFGRYGGDIQGIINHVPYINDMGFTAVWSSPLLTNDQEKYTYHGYAISNLYEIDPRFGTMEDYLNLSNQLHENNMKLIMDIIPNHIGAAHEWMKDMPSKNWFNNEGEFAPTNHVRSTLHDPHSSASDSTSFVNGWFVKSMPDLNQRNKHLSTYLIQNAIWWIEQASLDGLRVDTYSYSDKRFLSDWSCAIMKEYPSFNLVGEEWSLEPAFVSYWQEGSTKNPTSCLPSLFDFPTQDALIKALNEEDSWNGGWSKVYDAIAMDFLYPDPNNLMVFVDNHDMDRFYKQINHNLDLYKMGIAYILTTRGIPQIYYGTEILLANTIHENHGDIRMPFPSNWPSDTSNAISGEGLSMHQKEAQAYMKQLLQFRKTSSAITNGKLTHYNPKEGVYVYFRTSTDQSLMIVMNKNKDSKSLSLERFSENLKADAKGFDVINATSIDMTTSLSLKPMSGLIIELQ